MRSLILILIILALAGCLPATALPASSPSEGGKITADANQPETSLTPEESPASEDLTGGKSPLVLELARQDLAVRLNLDPSLIGLLSLESLVWPDGGLGCPLPGAEYAQVLTPGFKISLEAGGEVYSYHTNTEVGFLLCLDGTPQLPLIPLDPGEIQDGSPWMPVDPPPDVEEGGPSVDPAPVY